jgi:hypothetical protein
MNVSSRPVLAGVVVALAVAAAELVLATATGAHARSGWTVTTQVTVHGEAVDPPGSTATPPAGDPAGERERTTEPPQPANPSAAPTTSVDSPPPVEHTDAEPAPVDPPPIGPAPHEPTPAAEATEVAPGNDP